MRRLRRLLTALPLLLSLACASTTAPSYPAAEWHRSTPAAAGYRAAALDSITVRLQGMPTTGLMAVHDGRVFFEYGDVDTVTYLASVRKSVLSMLFGNYVRNGTIDLDRTLADLGIDDVGGLLPIERQARIRDLLAARSGVYHEASNAGDDLASAPPRGSQQPGTYYLYNNWDFNALGTIFEQLTGRSIYDVLESDLVRPIGMQDFNRASHRRTGNASRSQHLAYHMNFSTRDMARVGYLMLRNGRWNGRQIVPEDWVRESTRAITPVTEMNPAARRNGVFGYGYLWWVFDGPNAGPAYRGGYAGLGAYGQHIVVLPAIDLVLAHKTAPGERSVSHNEFLEIVDLFVRARR